MVESRSDRRYPEVGKRYACPLAFCRVRLLMMMVLLGTRLSLKCTPPALMMTSPVSVAHGIYRVTAGVESDLAGLPEGLLAPLIVCHKLGRANNIYKSWYFPYRHP